MIWGLNVKDLEIKVCKTFPYALHEHDRGLTGHEQRSCTPACMFVVGRFCFGSWWGERRCTPTKIVSLFDLILNFSKKKFKRKF